MTTQGTPTGAALIEEREEGRLGFRLPLDDFPPELREKILLAVAANGGEWGVDDYEIIDDGEGGKALHLPSLGLTICKASSDDAAEQPSGHRGGPR